MRTYAIALSIVLIMPVTAAAAPWEHVELPQEYGDPAILGIVTQNDTLWISSQGSGLIGFFADEWFAHTTENSGISKDSWNYRVFLDSGRDLWVSRDNQKAIDRLDNAGTFADTTDDRWWNYVYPDQLSARRVFSIAEAPGGLMWFGIRDENHTQGVTVELFTGESDTVSSDDWHHFDKALSPDSTGFSHDDVRALAVDDESRLWIGYYATGVDVWDYGNYATYADDSWMHYTTEDGLPSNLVHTIHVAPDGLVWVGTLGGLGRYDPVSQDWTVIEGLPGSQARAIDSDAQGHVWVGTDQGVAMLYSNGTVAFTFDTDHGLQNDRIDQLAVDRSSGRIWAVSVDDLTQATHLNVYESGFVLVPGSNEFFAYPNPWIEGRSAEDYVSLFAVPEGSAVEILDILGEHVRDLRPTEPYIWDTLDDDFNKAPAGVYLARIQTPEGKQKVLKVAIVR